jgi:hypothetical protein
MADYSVFDLYYDEYFPFRLYADYKRGATVDQIAREFSLPVYWVEERLEAVRLCVERQVRLDVVHRAPTAA